MLMDAQTTPNRWHILPRKDLMESKKLEFSEAFQPAPPWDRNVPWIIVAGSALTV
jgi:hypothetical protein